MRKNQAKKRKYSDFTVKDAMLLIQAENFLPWQLNTLPRPASDFLIEDLRRLRSFDLQMSELAKTLLIDSLFSEIIPNYPKLKVWKAAWLETDELTGTADYLITPDRAYIATPLMGVAEAKKDDFVQGRAQCLAEMVACQWSNLQENHMIDVYGIVSNGQAWQFYKLTLVGEIFETGLYTTEFLPELLGSLDYVCSECAKNVP